MQLHCWARRPDANIATRADVNRAGWRAGPDAERQTRAASHVANEEVGFVAGYVPSLRCKPAAVVLFEPDSGGVGGIRMDVQDRRGGAEPQSSRGVNEDGVSRRTRSNRERDLGACYVLD